MSVDEEMRYEKQKTKRDPNAVRSARQTIDVIEFFRKSVDSPVRAADLAASSAAPLGSYPFFFAPGPPPSPGVDF